MIGVRVKSSSPEETMNVAERFAAQLESGELVALTGELGAGKTVFAKGLCHGLGCEQMVSSPSFTLVNIYQGIHMIFHLDCYRLVRPAEIEELDLKELFYPAGITIVEWAEKIKDYLPPRKWIVQFEIISESQRQLTFFKDHWPGGQRAT
jgi:tRNA threonylcarbamoyladenosine biosynthesis protein TsaE